MKPARLICLILSLACALSAFGQEYTRERVSEHRTTRKMWWTSLAVLAVVSVADVHSSIDKYEHNPLLRRNTGQFSPGRGIAAKAAMIGAIAGSEYLWFRRSSDMPRAVSFMNFAAAGAIGSVALRNYGVAKRPIPATPMR